MSVVGANFLEDCFTCHQNVVEISLCACIYIVRLTSHHTTHPTTPIPTPSAAYMRPWIYFSISSGNGLSPLRCQAITWPNPDLLWIGPWGTDLSEIFIEIHTSSFKNMHLKMSFWNGGYIVLGVMSWCLYMSSIDEVFVLSICTRHSVIALMARTTRYCD